MATNKLLLMYELQDIVSRLSAERAVMTEKQKQKFDEAKALIKILISQPRMLHFF